MSLSGRTVFLDRDGTLNKKPAEGSYVTKAADLELLPGAAEAVRILNEAGALAVVVTNQRGIARGLMTEDDLANVHRALTRRLASRGAYLDAIYHCPHDIGQCECRKPEIGMLRRAFDEIPAATQMGAALVGDSDSDIEAARRAKITAVAIAERSRCLRLVPDIRAASLLDAMRILERSRPCSVATRKTSITVTMAEERDTADSWPGQRTTGASR